ncbi:MAG: TonB-dependent receptor [Myxococcota bacterium]
MRWLCLMLALLAYTPAPLFAQDADERDGTTVGDDEIDEGGEVDEGGDIEVRDQRLRPVEVFQDTAIETETVTEEQVKAIPATDAAEVLQYLAGIRTSQRIQGQEAAISIEGMPPEYTKLLVDGERWSGEIGGVGDAADIPLQNVKRIELLRGNQGVRYGSDSGGGVVNIITHDAPSEGWKFGFRGAGGSDRRAIGGGTGALRLGPIGFSLSGEYDQINGFDEPSDPDIVSAQVGGDESQTQSYFLYAKWDAPIGDAITLRGNAAARIEDDDFVPEDSDDNLPRTDTNYRVNTGIEWLALDSTQVTVNGNYYAVETDSDVGRSFTLFEDEWKGELLVDHYMTTWEVEHSIVAGVESLVQRLRLDEGTLPPNIENDGLAAGRREDESFFNPSVYIQTESALTDWFSLVLGGRIRFHSEFEERVLPQAAILLKPHDTLKLRASGGLNYRTPSLRDLFQPPTPQLGGAYFLAGNENLEPEDSLSLRGSFEWSPFDWVSLSSSAFYNDIDDFIRSQFAETISIGTTTVLVDPTFTPEIAAICQAQRMFFPDPADWTPECVAFFSGMQVAQQLPLNSNVFRKTNLDSVITWGGEAQLRLRYGRWVQVLVDYTFLRTEVKDSNIDADELPNEPEHAVTGRAVFRVPHLETQITGTALYRSGVIPERSGTGLLSFADSTARTDPSYRFDVRVVQPLPDSWSLPGAGRISLFGDFLNVTDERREDSYSIRGRSFFVGLVGEFSSPAL